MPKYQIGSILIASRLVHGANGANSTNYLSRPFRYICESHEEDASPVWEPLMSVKYKKDQKLIGNKIQKSIISDQISCYFQHMQIEAVSSILMRVYAYALLRGRVLLG